MYHKTGVCVPVDNPPPLKVDNQKTIAAQLSAKELTDQRSKHYGHPIDHFSTTRGLSAVWDARRNEVQSNDSKTEKALRHSVYMILDKLSRAANDPTHADNWDDIAGYARCAKMILGLEK
jgi:hypothetical protein